LTSGAPQAKPGSTMRVCAGTRSSPEVSVAMAEATEDVHLSVQAASTTAPSTGSATTEEGIMTKDVSVASLAEPEIAEDYQVPGSAILPPVIAPALNSTVGDPLNSTVGDLQSCRIRLERLRAEKRSAIPIGEVEQWCESIAAQLAAIGNDLIAKLDLCRSKIRMRDETILRLHRQVHELSALCESSGIPIGQAGLQYPEVSATSGGARSMNSRSAGQLGSVGDIDSTPLSSTSRNYVRSPEAEKVPSGGSLRTRRAPGATSPDPAFQKMLARRGSTDGGAVDKAKVAQDKREVQQLRRGHLELISQLQAKDAKIENLTAMIRDLASQRQMGQNKRHSLVQEEALHALQEDLVLEQASPPAPLGRLGPAAPASPTTDGPRIARGMRNMSGNASGPSLIRRIARQPGNASRVLTEVGVSSSTELRGRGGSNAGGSSGGLAATRRERSISNAPYTPRNKLRDAIGLPTRVAVETPASRNSARTTSFARAVAANRSNSVEDRNSRRG
jgi:hypothetical protein